MLNNKKMIEKPWGSEVIWAETGDYVGKIIFINKDHRLSRQYHEKKEETILVKRGSLTLEIGSIDSGGIKTHLLLAGETFHILPGIIHRFCAVKGPVELIEVSTPFLEDVVRLEDDYARSE